MDESDLVVLSRLKSNPEIEHGIEGSSRRVVYRYGHWDPLTLAYIFRYPPSRYWCPLVGVSSTKTPRIKTSKSSKK